MTGKYTTMAVVAGLLWFALIIIWATFARESKASQCNRLVEVINGAAEAQPNLPGRTIAEDDTVLLAMSVKLETYAKQLESMHFGDSQLRTLQTHVASHYRTISQASHDVVYAPKNRLQSVRQANNALIAAQESESSLVQEVNQYCRS